MDDAEIRRRVYDLAKSRDVEGLRRQLLGNLNLFANASNAGDLDFELRVAVSQNAPEIIEVLAEFGANVNGHDNSRLERPIVETCLGGSCKLEAAEELLKLGAKVNHEIDGEVRCKALDLAISKGNLDMVKLLIKHGAAFNSIYQGMTAVDHALSRGQSVIADYLRSIGGKTAEELGWVPPPEPELSQILADYFKVEYLTKLGTIHGLLDSNPVIDIHVFDEGVKIILHTDGMASKPIPTDAGQEELQYAEIEMTLPQGWPTGEEMLMTDETAWPVQWLRRLAYHPHQDDQPIGKLFFYPNGSPPKPFAKNTEMCYWMLMLANKPPIYVSHEKQIAVYIAVPLYKEEYALVQRHGLGELGRRFDENKIYPHQMFFRKNVGVNP